MKDNFDDIVKRKWERMQFPVDENHRTDMIHLLDQNKRRRGVFFWLGGIVVVIVAGSMVLLSTNNDEVVTGKTNSEMMETSEMSPSISSGSSSHANSVVEELTKQHKSGTSSSSEKSPDPVSNTFSEQINNKQKKSGSFEKEINANQSEENIKIKETEISTQQKSINSKARPDMTLITPMDNIDDGNIAKIDQGVSDEKSKSKPSGDDERKINIPLIEDVARDVSLVGPIESLPVSTIDVENLTAVPIIKPGFSKDHPFTYFAEAGVGYVPPSFPDIKSGWSMEIGGGVHYSLLKSTNLFFSAGYYLQKGGFDFQRTSTADQPGFGTRSISNSLTPDKLHFIYSKLGVEQKFRRHSITAALGLQWLYGAQGTIDIRSQDQFNQQAADETKYAWLVLDGMNRMILSGELDYGYQLSPRFKLSLGLKHYISRMTQADEALKNEGYYWRGKLAPFNPSFTIQYRIYGK